MVSSETTHESSEDSYMGTPLVIGSGGADESAGGVLTQTYKLISPDITWGQASYYYAGHRPVRAFMEESDFFEGNYSARIDFSEVSNWGGIYFHNNPTGTAVYSTADYKNGALVFSLKGDVASMEVKIESEDEEASLNISDFPPAEHDNGWKTYTLPLASFRAVNPDLDRELLTVFAGLWNPHTSAGALVSDYFLLDNIHYTTSYESDVESITLSPGQFTLIPEIERQIMLTSQPGNLFVEPSEATWSSSNTSVVTVSDQGVLTSIAVGEADITVEYEGVSTSVTVEVLAEMPPFGINYDDNKTLGGLRYVNLTEWGGVETNPTVLEDVLNREGKAIRYSLPGSGAYGAAWLQAGSTMDVSLYENMVIVYNDSQLDKAVDSSIVELVSPSGIANYNTVDGGFPGQISEADEAGWKTITVPLQPFADRGVDLSDITVVKFSDWRQFNPGEQEPEDIWVWLEGDFYIGDVRFE